jgi:hypothetical protein
MANEITLRFSLAAEKGGASIASTTQTKQLTLAGDDMTAPTQLIGHDADEALVTGDVAAPAGYLLIKNLDASNYVELSTGTGGSFAAGKFAKIRAGCPCMFQPLGPVYAQANTADVRVQIWAVAA